MTDTSIWMPDLTAMTEAARLTKAGRLQEATALIQRGLSGAVQPAENRKAETIDHRAGRIEAMPHAAATDELHAAILPERVRETMAQVLRGLRGVAPALKEFGESFGLHGKPPHKPDDVPEDRFVERSFSNSAGARDYKLFIPSRQAGRRPLVIMLHGCTQSPDDFALGTGMNALAEVEGIYVAYPRQSQAANGQKCWNWFQTGDQGRERGEAGIIAGITRAIMAEHLIDPARVYIAGLSAGGAAAANIARAYPDLYAAVGVHSGLAAGCAQDLMSALMAMKTGAPGGELPGASSGFGSRAMSAATRVPTIVFHGDSDATVNPKNGEAVLAQAGIANLTLTRETGTEPGGHGFVRTRYADATGRTQVESWVVKGSGHAWSGGSTAGSYTDPRGPDASRAMLDFFESHRLGDNLRS